jgi:hypothetical protein
MKANHFCLLVSILIPLLGLLDSAASARTGVRQVSSTSCEIIRVNVGLGMTTQIILEQEPQVTLFADKKHFKINTNSSSPRSLAVIPFSDGNDLSTFRDSAGHLPSQIALASVLDKNFKTNLFVFFKNNNQLSFELRFVERDKADNILKVTQLFKEDCVL